MSQMNGFTRNDFHWNLKRLGATEGQLELAAEMLSQFTPKQQQLIRL